jgi:hypothetical protein
MQLALGNVSDAMAEYQKLAAMNIGGSLDADLVALRKSIDSMQAPHICRPSEASCPD